MTTPPHSPTPFEIFCGELALYRADERFLTVDKCAERCRKLSALLTLAVRGQARARSNGDRTHFGGSEPKPIA